MYAKQRRGGGYSFPATHQSGRGSLLIVSWGTCDLSVWIEGLWKVFIITWAKILRLRLRLVCLNVCKVFIIQPG